MSTPELQPPAKQSIDIGQAVQFVLNDPEWWRTAIAPGLCMLIPVVGPVIHMGWQRRMFHHIKAGGNGLLPADIQEDLTQGLAPFAAALTTGLLALVVMLILYLPGLFIMMIGGATEVEVISMMGLLFTFAGHIALFPLGLCLGVFMLEVIRRGYHGEMTPVLSPGESIARIRQHPVPYIMTAVSYIVGSVLGGLGFYACVVGGIVTAPAGNAMNMHALAQWDSLSAE